MKKICFLLFDTALTLLFLAVCLIEAAEPIKDVLFEFDRTGQVYQISETAKVTMTVIAEDGRPVDEGMLYVRQTNDGRDTLAWDEIDLSKRNPVTLDASLSFPGHILIKVTATNSASNGNIDRSAGLLFDPEKIEPVLPKPDDFDEFWAKGRADVRTLLLGLSIKPIDKLCSETLEVSEIRFATVGGQYVYGFLSKPVGEGPFPALVHVPGAGPGTGPIIEIAEEGFAVLAMNVFPYPVLLDSQENLKIHDEFNKSLGCRYIYWNSDNRDTYFYRPVYLGIDRAIDWFAAQPFVNKERLGFYGTSQGGGAALILSGMNKNIKAVVASIPASCDHAGCLAGRSSGAPNLVDTAEGDEAVLNASRYFDAVNFARSIDVPIRITVGFIDTTCSPSSVWSAFNVIPSNDKEILSELNLGHQNGTQYSKAEKWLKKKLKEL